MNVIHKLVAIAAALSIATGLAACGDDGDDGGGADSAQEQQVRAVLTRLQEAGRAGEGGEICRDLFTKALAESIREAAESKRCGIEVNRNIASPDTTIDTQDVKVDAKKGTAIATVKDQTGRTSKITVIYTGTEWRIGRIQPA